MLLAVNVVVRDDATQLAACLASVRAVADEVVVYDTGSVDDSPAVARQAGATVVDGEWEEDFSTARNGALARTRADWVLSVDSDERFRGDPGSLRLALQEAPPGQGFTVTVTNLVSEERGGTYRHQAPRLFRRAGTAWRGRVHEEPVGPQLRTLAPLAEATGSLLHLGYSDPGLQAGKSARNAALAQTELDTLLLSGAPDPLRVAELLLDRGRSLLGAGRRQGAVDAFETVRDMVPGTPAWEQATDFLARVLLAAGEDEVVLVLVAQLRQAGVSAAYCDWLAASALAQLGRAQEALASLRGVHALVDPAGREYDVGQVHELRALIAAVAGDRQEAVRSLARAMAEHGRVRGRGALLLELATGLDVDLAELLLAHGSPCRDDLVAELVTAGAEGRRVACRLGAGLTSP